MPPKGAAATSAATKPTTRSAVTTPASATPAQRDTDLPELPSISEAARRVAWTAMKKKKLVEATEEKAVSIADVSLFLKTITTKSLSGVEVKNQLGNLLLILDAQIAEETYEHFDVTVGNAMETGLNRLTEYIDNNIKAYLDAKIKDAYSTSEGIRDDIQAATKNLDNAAGSILEHAKNIASAPAPRMASFASTAQQAFAPDHQDVLLRNDRRSRQLTLTPNPDWSTQATKLTPREMVAKANEAMGSIDPGNYTPGEDHFTTCRILNSGSVILEAKSKATIADLQDEHIRSIFLAALGAGFAQVKDSSYSMLLKFVPIAAGLDEPDAWRAIELRQGWKDRDFISARWIKKPERRTERQMVANMMVRFRTTEVANEAARTGFLHGAERFWPIRPEPEPTRCYKCHRLGSHFARECKSAQQICGTCGEEGHDSPACHVLDPAQQRCVNCRTNGHSSRDRQCPALANARLALMRRLPESTYKYFPNESQDWTWEQDPERAGQATQPGGRFFPARNMQPPQREYSLGEGARFISNCTPSQRARRQQHLRHQNEQVNPPPTRPDNGYTAKSIEQLGTQRTLDRVLVPDSQPTQSTQPLGEDGEYTTDQLYAKTTTHMPRAPTPESTVGEV